MSSTKYKIYIKDLPRLQYILYLSRDYHDRVSLWKKEHREFGMPLAPKLLQKQEFTSIFRKNYGKKQVFGFQNEYKSTKTIENGEGMHPSINVNGTEDILLVLKDVETVDGYERLELTKEEKSQLTSVLENDIFEYISKTNKILEENKTNESSHLESLIQTGKGILKKQQSKCSQEPPFLCTCPKEISDKLNRLRDKGVHCYSCSQDTFSVYVLENDQTDKESLSEEIRGILHHFHKSPEIIFLSEKPKLFCAKPGAILVAESKKSDYNTSGKSYGAVGVFGRTVAGDLVFTTAGHLFSKEGEKVYVNCQNGINEIGECIACCRHDTSISPDFAVVKVDVNEAPNCEVRFPTMNGNRNPSYSLYEEPKGALTYEIVHKEDPIHGLTSGIVQSEEFRFTCSDDNFIEITNSNQDIPFAKPGDSGAAVFRIVPGVETQEIEVISTVLSGNDGPPNCISYRIDKALQNLEKEKAMKINVGHQP